MKVLSRVIITAAKSSLLASSLLSFSLAVSVNELFENIILIFLVSMLITFMISTFMICATIMPFYKIKPELNFREKFKRYFPWYSISFFSICLFLIYKSNYEEIVLIILGIAYISAMQSWVWFFKQKNITIRKKKI